jgi:hypothetical protein
MQGRQELLVNKLDNPRKHLVGNPNQHLVRIHGQIHV